MRRRTVVVELVCDAPGCPGVVVAQRWQADGDGHELPVDSLPKGWRERRTRYRVQHACSAECERALTED
jgi:hypothetical protein